MLQCNISIQVGMPGFRKKCQKPTCTSQRNAQQVLLKMYYLQSTLLSTRVLLLNFTRYQDPSIHISQTQRHHAMFFTATRTSIRQKTFGHIVFQTNATWMKPIFTRFTLHPKPTRVLLHLAMAPRVDLLRTKKTKKRRTQKPNQNNKHKNMRSKHSTPHHHHHHHN